DYRDCLRDLYQEIAHIAEKHCAARSIHDKWVEHQQKGTMPPALSLRTPEIPLSKVFAESDQGSELRNSFAELSKVHMDKLLADGIAIKQKEVDFLNAQLQPEPLFERLKTPIVARSNELLQRHRVMVFSHGPEQGEIHPTGEWKESPRVREQFFEMLEDCTSIALRILSIVEDREARASKKLEKKKAIASSVDVEMADGTSSAGPASSSEVKKMVKDLVAKELKVKDNKGKVR
ncbi:hypothetical protein HDZ31DRAFT_10690, partial [Schizophyllum fasciatum]